MNRTNEFSKRIQRIIFAAILLLAALVSCLFAPMGKGGTGKNIAKAETVNLAVHKYVSTVQVEKDRSVRFREQITVEFLEHGLTMFFRSLPIDQGDRYFDITAKCDENPDFSFGVVNNPKNNKFIDIECKGGAEKGNIWTYELEYTMHSTSNERKNGLILDVIGSGWEVPLDNVDVTVLFPEAVEDYDVYSGRYGSSGNDYASVTLSEDKKVLTMHADKLPVLYNSSYGEYVAAGITLSFALPEGTLKSYASTRLFTPTFFIILLVGAVGVVLACLAVIFSRKPREIVRVVNLKAPKDMDPLQMGKLIDGSIEDSDVTSIIYYFAAKGYLTIDLSDDTDPVLNRTNRPLPTSAPSYQKAIYQGLFSSGDRVPVSALKYKFYETAQKAKLLVSAKGIRHYEPRSIRGFVLGAAIGALLFFLVPFLTGIICVAGNYYYIFGGIMAAPIFLISLFLKHVKDWEFKDTPTKRTVKTVIAVILAAIVSVAFFIFFGGHLLTGSEKACLAVLAWTAVFIAPKALSRTEKYTAVLGDILGFKDFIVYTEEDKIKFMLEENPELFYDILPYAQVLGVTDEWEKKFQNLTLEPPFWCTGCSSDTLFSYMLMSRYLRSISQVAMAIPEAKGSGVGMSCGGGGFGGFSGGGHGGGGGGAK